MVFLADRRHEVVAKGIPVGDATPEGWKQHHVVGGVSGLPVHASAALWRLRSLLEACHGTGRGGWWAMNVWNTFTLQDVMPTPKERLQKLK